jgi:hypothetical protein
MTYEKTDTFTIDYELMKFLAEKLASEDKEVRNYGDGVYVIGPLTKYDDTMAIPVVR